MQHRVPNMEDGGSSSFAYMSGLGCRYMPMSAGQRVARVGIMLGGSSWTSVGADVRFAMGANFDKMWKQVSRMR
jgi:hypothetical protein